MGDERDDLIARLRNRLFWMDDRGVAQEAADEIVRLRGEVAKRDAALDVMEGTIEAAVEEREGLRAALDAADDLYDAVEDHGHMDDCPAVAAFRAAREVCGWEDHAE